MSHPTLESDVSLRAVFFVRSPMHYDAHAPHASFVHAVIASAHDGNAAPSVLRERLLPLLLLLLLRHNGGRKKRVKQRLRCSTMATVQPAVRTAIAVQHNGGRPAVQAAVAAQWRQASGSNSGCCTVAAGQRLNSGAVFTSSAGFAGSGSAQRAAAAAAARGTCAFPRSARAPLGRGSHTRRSRSASRRAWAN